MSRELVSGVDGSLISDGVVIGQCSRGERWSRDGASDTRGCPNVRPEQYRQLSSVG